MPPGRRTRALALAGALVFAGAAARLASAHPHDASDEPALVPADSAAAEADTTRRSDKLRPGAWEFGGGGSISNSSGFTYGIFELRGAKFARAGRGLVGFETLLGYSRVSDSSVGDAQLGITLQRPLFIEGLTRERGAVWPYVGLASGVSQSWEPGHEDTRFPVTGALGVRMMSGRSSAVRVEARITRMLGVETGDYTQSGYFVGYSWVFNNPR
jgi:hypothetical protein